jgi:hypothetical protein
LALLAHLGYNLFAWKELVNENADKNNCVYLEKLFQPNILQARDENFQCQFHETFETFFILPFQHFSLTQWMHRFCKILPESFLLAIFSIVKLVSVNCLG